MSEISLPDLINACVEQSRNLAGPVDPRGIPQHAPGAKMDAGKPMAGLIWGFSRALEAVVAVATYGARKYTRDGWNHVPDAIQRYQDAADRHTLAMQREELDPESGMPHEWHALWNRIAVLELKLRQQNNESPTTGSATGDCPH